MLAVIGDETGLIKIIDPVSNTILNINGFNLQSRANGVTDLVALSDQLIASIRSSGRVDLLAVTQTEEKKCVLKTLFDFSTNIGDSCGIITMLTDGTQSEKFLCYGSSKFSYYQMDSNGSTDDFTSDHLTNLLNFTLPGPVQCCTLSKDGGMISGGKENEVNMINILTQQEIWKAKNVPNDNLDLRIPVWLTDLAYLNPRHDSMSGATFASVTGYKHLRMYDTKANQLPVVSIDTGGDYKLTCVQPLFDIDETASTKVYVSDAGGNIDLWDLRQSKQKLCSLIGFQGSVRDLCLSPDGNQLHCVGLDRTLRNYDTKTNKLIGSTYAHNRLTACVAIKTEGLSLSISGKKRSFEGEDESDNGEEICDDILEEYVTSEDEGNGD